MTALTGTGDDREEIRELYARYAHTIDAGRFDEWIDCFTSDGAFESPRFGRHVGRDGLRKFTAIYKDALGGAKSVHQMSNVTFVVRGDRASGGCYLAAYHCKDGRAELSAVGRYIDKLRKVDGHWKFETRQVVIDGVHR